LLKESEINRTVMKNTGFKGSMSLIRGKDERKTSCYQLTEKLKTRQIGEPHRFIL
jgi:hypothetical protein